MRLVDRYIVKTVLASIALVTLMLTGLQLFILFVNQINDLGKADYGLLQASLYVFLQVPYQVYLFFPMASLLGCLIGLGVLANHHELVVMRASGVSIAEVTLAVFKVALFLILLVTALGETLMPRLIHYAYDQKMQALNGGQTLRTAHGIWLRQANDFIFIGTILPDYTLQQVYQYHFNENHTLQFARRIDSIHYVAGQWQAQHIAETTIYPKQTVAKLIPAMAWEVNIKPDLLMVSSHEPDEMSLLELHQYLRAQSMSHQIPSNYQLAFWQRLVQPLTTLVMMLLAIPFIFGPLRSSTMGAKLLLGVTIGFGFYIINRFFGPLSHLFQWPPALAALAPTVLFACLGVYLMHRVK